MYFFCCIGLLPNISLMISDWSLYDIFALACLGGNVFFSPNPCCFFRLFMLPLGEL